MSSILLIRTAQRASGTILRSSTPTAARIGRPGPPAYRSTLVASPAPKHFSSTRPTAAAPDGGDHDAHQEETFEEFTARYEKEFEQVQDVFELQRNLNNAFAYDLVPSPSVLVAALHAARRVNDFPTAVRIFEGVKSKVENKGQYEQYLEELKDLREDLGVMLVEDLFPGDTRI